MNIDLKPNDIMFNSGVMLIDLKKWKEKKVETRLLKFISKKHGHIQQGDQGALNHVLSHDIYCFEPRFNSVTIFYDLRNNFVIHKTLVILAAGIGSRFGVTYKEDKPTVEAAFRKLIEDGEYKANLYSDL